MYLPNAQEEELVHGFVYGLKETIRTMVLLQDAQTLNEAQSMALAIDERKYF